MSTPDNIPADVREAIEKAWEDAFDAYCKECGDSSAHQAAGRSLLKSIAPFFAAKDAEIADLKRQLDEAQRRLGEAYGQFSGAEETIAKLNVDLNRHHGMALHNIARAEATEKQLAEAQRDSKRLDWLDQNIIGSFGPVATPENSSPFQTFCFAAPENEDIRAAIDAAMQQEVKQ